MKNIINCALMAEKKLFVLLTAVICLVGCGEGISSKNEINRSSKYAWSYIGQKRSNVEEQLKNAGWKQNYSGKTYSGSPVVLYVYNRPSDLSWGPCHYTKYATSTQKTNRDALSRLVQNGEPYGELFMIFGDDYVNELGLFWLVNSSQGKEKYQTFSNNIYKAFSSDFGTNANWRGTIESLSYRDHQQFLDALENYSNPTTEENGSYSSSAERGNYEIYTTYDYYLNNSFYMSFEGWND